MEQYLDILEESLRKKVMLLDRIIDSGVRQKELLSTEGTEFEDFDPLWEERDAALEQIELLDEGFESLYDKAAEDLKENRERYADQIRTLQELIRQVTERINTVHTQEERNKKLFEEYFTRRRSEVKKGRISTRAAMSYYQTGRPTVPDASILDSKK